MPEQLDLQAACTPDGIAIVAPGRLPLTYRQLGRQVAVVVEALNGLAVGRGDRVAVLLPSGPEMAVALLGVAAGATCAPLNPAYRARECESCLTELGATALLVQAGWETPARAAARARGIQLIELSPVPGAEAGLFSLAGESRRGPARRGLAEPEDVALVLPTSGTTARPRLVPLTHLNICAAANNTQRALELTSRDRCLNVMPLFHGHGLVAGLLSSIMVGASVVCTPGFDVSRFFGWIDECGPTWYTAVPAMHQAVLAMVPNHRPTIGRSPLRFIRSASAPLPRQLSAELERGFNVPITESYGLTEALQLTNTPFPPRTRKPGSVGVAAAGIDLGIMGEAGDLLQPGEVGEVACRGAPVTSGYENDPIANAAAFRDGWFRTGDQGFLDADGYLFLTGRLKEIINRGGEKISPQAVDGVLMEHPAITEAVTFALPHPTLGEDVAAAVVLKEKAAATDGDIRDFAATRLAQFAVPRRIVIVKGLPKGPTGKTSRIGLAENLGLVAPRSAGHAVPRTPTEAALAAIWAEVLRLEQVGVHDDFFSLGGDSLRATMISSRVRVAFHVELSVASFFEARTVARLAVIILQQQAAGAGVTFQEHATPE